MVRRAVDVEIGTLEDRPCADVLLEENNPPLRELLEGVGDFGAEIWMHQLFENRSLCGKSRSVPEQVDDGDVLDQCDMQRIGRFSFGALDGFHSLSPAMAIVGRQDGRLQVRPQVFPIVVGAIPRRVEFARRFQIGAKAMGLDRSQESKRAALVLPKLPLGDRAKQCRHRRVQRPASFQSLGEPFPHRGPSSFDRVGDSDAGRSHPGRGVIGFDSPSDKLDHFVARGDQRDVSEAALDLCPVIAGVDAKARCVLAKRLMKDANDDDAS